MLIETIKFEIRNFQNGTAETFIIANTPGVYEMVASHRKTRDIEFKDMFDFEFVSKRTKAPKFIQFGLSVANALIENEMLEEIDEIDEMVGTY